jgi:drug/metabolite transporter (DMT)-like permease
MSWQLLTAISVLGLSSSVVLQRLLMHKDKVDPFAYAVTFQAIVGMLLTIFAVFYGFHLPGIENLLLPAIFSVICFGIGHIVYAKTLQYVEASVFSVLFATQAIWIMLLGILLFNENLTAIQIFGSVLIFVGVCFTIKDIRSLSFDKGTLLGLLTGLIFGVAITAWSYVGRNTDGLSWAATSFLCASLVACLVRPKTIRHIKPLLNKRILKRLILLGVFYGIGSLTMLFAYKEGTFTVISPLRQTSIIITTLLALLFLSQERNRVGWKLLAAAVCFTGVILVVI